jgi:hypothetical protein
VTAFVRDCDACPSFDILSFGALNHNSHTVALRSQLLILTDTGKTSTVSWVEGGA